MERIKAHFTGGGIADGSTVYLEEPFKVYAWSVDFPLRHKDVYERRDIVDPESLEISKADYVYVGRSEITGLKDIEKHHCSCSQFERFSFAIDDLGKAIIKTWPFKMMTKFVEWLERRD